MPDLEPGDLPFLFELEEWQLESMRPIVLRWECAAAHCAHSTHIWDLGVRPKVYWKKGKKWVDLSCMVYYCGRHWKRLNEHKKAVIEAGKRVKCIIEPASVPPPFELKHHEFINTLLP